MIMIIMIIIKEPKMQQTAETMVQNRFIQADRTNRVTPRVMTGLYNLTHSYL